MEVVRNAALFSVSGGVGNALFFLLDSNLCQQGVWRPLAWGLAYLMSIPVQQVLHREIVFGGAGSPTTTATYVRELASLYAAYAISCVVGVAAAAAAAASGLSDGATWIVATGASGLVAYRTVGAAMGPPSGAVPDAARPVGVVAAVVWNALALARGSLLAALFCIFVVAPLVARTGGGAAEATREYFAVSTAVARWGSFAAVALPALAADAGAVPCWVADAVGRYKLPRGGANPPVLPPAKKAAADFARVVAGHALQVVLGALLLHPLFRLAGVGSLGLACSAHWLPSSPPVDALGRVAANDREAAVVAAAAALAVCQLAESALFYATHRAFHSVPWLWAIHKRHHEYSGSVAYAAEHAHPVEQFLGNMVPVLAGPLLVGASHPVWLTWVVWRAAATYERHSGYAFVGTLLSRCGLLHAHGVRYHDIHHRAGRANYGSALDVFDVAAGSRLWEWEPPAAAAKRAA